MNSGDSHQGSEIHTPESLVGKKVLHKFQVEGEEKWYNGYVVSYNAVTHLHEVAYDEEEEYYYFNLLEGIIQGDLIINDWNIHEICLVGVKESTQWHLDASSDTDSVHAVFRVWSEIAQEFSGGYGNHSSSGIAYQQ